jgi:hypothetical protein
LKAFAFTFGDDIIPYFFAIIWALVISLTCSLTPLYFSHTCVEYMIFAPFLIQKIHFIFFSFTLLSQKNNLFHTIYFFLDYHDTSTKFLSPLSKLISIRKPVRHRK